MTKAKIGILGVLMKFFGKKPGQKLEDFRDEVHELSEAIRLELARLAAVELGLSQTEVTFKL